MKINCGYTETLLVAEMRPFLLRWVCCVCSLYLDSECVHTWWDFISSDSRMCGCVSWAVKLADSLPLYCGFEPLLKSKLRQAEVFCLQLVRHLPTYLGEKWIFRECKNRNEKKNILIWGMLVLSIYLFQENSFTTFVAMTTEKFHVLQMFRFILPFPSKELGRLRLFCYMVVRQKSASLIGKIVSVSYPAWLPWPPSWKV